MPAILPVLETFLIGVFRDSPQPPCRILSSKLLKRVPRRGNSSRESKKKIDGIFGVFDPVFLHNGSLMRRRSIVVRDPRATRT